MNRVVAQLTGRRWIAFAISACLVLTATASKEVVEGIADQ